jgi:adenylate cyclase
MKTPVASESGAAGYRISTEPHPRRVKIVFDGVVLADSERAVRLRETRHEPIVYLPKADVRMDLLAPTAHRSHCPFKGDASYWSIEVGDRRAENAVWAYEEPIGEAARIAGHVAFYRERVDEWIEEGAPDPEEPTAEPPAEANPLVEWLVRDAWQADSVDDLVMGLVRRLDEIDTELLRVNLIVRTLHPQVMGMIHLWNRGRPAVDRIELTHERSREERFLGSPFVHIFEGRGGVRRRLEGPDAKLDYPILEELRETGATDYAAMPIRFSDGQIHALTVVTDRPGGFETAHLGVLHEALPLLGRLVETHALRNTARTLLGTYLGRATGGRVLDGLIRRGDGEVIPAVVWWADLRGSTALAERLPREHYLELLNHFFECTAGPAIEKDGEVLKFIGDAVLAIFPLRDDPRAAEHALEAAREALVRIERFNASQAADDPKLAVALALHLGEVNYGNIGIEGRLDFTVTGPAVNTVARLERLSKKLGKPVVASGAFARLVRDQVQGLGTHDLAGLQTPVEVFTLNEFV